MDGTPSGVVRPAVAAPAQPVKAGTATQMRVLLGPEQGAPNFTMRLFSMGVGGGMPKHTNQVEHEQYVLRGRAQVTIGERVHDVGPHDTLYIPAGATHSYQVVEAPFEFLCVVPNATDQIRVIEGC